MRLRNPKGKRKTTCKCGNIPRKGQRYCNSCHAAYQRKNRKKHSELTDEQRKHANARSYLNTYIRRGKIIRGKCVICCKKKVEAHHEDYDNPLEVIWYCRKHHLEIHNKK